MKTCLLSSADFSPLSPAASPVREALRVLHRVNPALSWTGWAERGPGRAGPGLLLLDHRLVAGAPVWLKPLKFALSITAFTWTLGWLLADLPAPAQRSVRC